MSRDSIRLRTNAKTETGEKRELLIERAKELTGETDTSKAIDECIRRALSFEELMEREREALRERATELRTDHHRLKLRTAVERRGERGP